MLNKEKELDMDIEMPIKVSIIVPVYNIMEWLPRCVNSIRRQTYRNIEIILVDDGSTDNTGALCEKFALEDKRVRVFHKENGGSSSARNLGITKATGDYLGFVDSDDYIEPEMIEHLLGAILEENVRMAQASRDEINEDGTLRENVVVPPSKMEIRNDTEIMRDLLMHKGDCSFCTRLTDRRLFEDNLFPEGELNEDFYLLTKMMPMVGPVAVLPYQDYHVFYRMGSNSRTTDENAFPSVYTDIVKNADRVKEVVEKNYPQLVSEAFRFGMFQRLEYMLHIPIGMMTRDNAFYRSVAKNIRRNKWKALKCGLLTKKNKQYLFLLGTAPKIVRKIHRAKMKVKTK